MSLQEIWLPLPGERQGISQGSQEEMPGPQWRSGTSQEGSRGAHLGVLSVSPCSFFHLGQEHCYRPTLRPQVQGERRGPLIVELEAGEGHRECSVITASGPLLATTFSLQQESSDAGSLPRGSSLPPSLLLLDPKIRPSPHAWKDQRKTYSLPGFQLHSDKKPESLLQPQGPA